MLAEGGPVDQVLRDGRGLVVGAVDLLDHHAALAVELLGVDPRAAHEVAQQVDRRRRRLGAHGDVEGDEVVGGVGVQHAPQPLGGLVDVGVRRVLLAALEHEVLEEVRHPVLLGALGARARVERHQRGQRTRARHLDAVDGQAVGGDRGGGDARHCPTLFDLLRAQGVQPRRLGAMSTRRGPLTFLAALAAVVVLLLALVAAGIWWGGHPEDLPGFMQRTFVANRGTRVVDEALARIHREYYRPIGESQLSNASISGAVASLDDPFSHYLTAKELNEFDHPGSFSGIGVEVNPNSKGLQIVQVFNSSPAARAGLKPEDLIVAVNGRSLAGLPEDDGDQPRQRGPRHRRDAARGRTCRHGTGGRARGGRATKASHRHPHARHDLRAGGGLDNAQGPRHPSRRGGTR